MKKRHILLSAIILIAGASQAHAASIPEVIKSISGDYLLGNTSLHAAPIALANTDDAIYLELIVQGHETDVRQLVLTFTQQGDEVIARVHAFPEEIGDVMVPDLSTLAIGLWAAPDMFPMLLPSQLDPIVDVPVKVTDDGVRIAFESAPVVHLNAELLDADLQFSAEHAKWHRDGFDMNGSELWTEDVVFERVEIDPPVTRHDNGLVTIDIRRGAGSQLAEGDNVSFNYIGVLSDGRRFDSTQFPGRTPYGAEFPGNLFPALAQGLAGIECPTKVNKENQKYQPIRKIIIPPSLGFGEEGRGPVPGNSTMYYLSLVQSILDKTPD